MSQEAEAISHTRIQVSQENTTRCFVVPVVLVAIVQLLSQGGFVALAFATSDSNCSSTAEQQYGLVYSFELLMYTQSAMWVLFLLIDLGYTSQHRRLKLGGYLRYYKVLRRLQRATFFAFTFFAAGMLAYCTYAVNRPTIVFGLSRLCGAKIIVSVEAGAIVALSLAHLIKVVGVIRSSGAPDALEDTTAMSFRQHSLDSSEAIGFKAEDYVDDILERQADTIRCLREQNAALSKKLCHREWTALA